MSHTLHRLAPGVVLDARGAAFLEDTRTLAVADLHLGYAWAHRHRGQLLPLSAPDDTTARLLTLVREYRPQTLAILGDIVHATVPVADFRVELGRFLLALEAETALCLIAGNHDRWLGSAIARTLQRSATVGAHHLIHGDGISEEAARQLLADTKAAGGYVLLGHEHPAIRISDHVAHHARVPCFLTGDHWLALPAFTSWSSGSNVRLGTYLSPFPVIAPPRKAIALLARKLLPIPLDRERS